MPALSFRFKLLLAMMLVVAGVSVATLLITQKRVQANYENMFRQQFERQIAYFTALQDARLGAVEDQCLKFCRSVRLVAVMNESEIDVPDLYQIADGELRDVLNDMVGETKLPGFAAARRLRATFCRFLDSKGQPLQPPKTTRLGAGFLAGKRRLEQQLIFVREALSGGEQQQIGYLAVLKEPEANGPRPNLARAGNRPAARSDDPDQLHLNEVIVTKIIDPASGKALGALVVGFPVPDLIPHAKLDTVVKALNPNLTAHLNQIQSGILLEDRFYANSNVISTSTGSTVAQKVLEQIRTTKKLRNDFNCQVDNTRYRVFYDALNENSEFPPAYQVCLYSMEAALKEQKDLRWKILGSSGVALLGALLLSLLISHGLAVPIRELVAGTGEIQRGNFQFKVPVRSRDEIGQLAASFNEMADGLAQKEKYRTVLNMVADEKVAQQLMSGQVALGGELREITVLFCDIRGFTGLTQNMPPHEVIDMLNEHMTALTRVVKQHNGVVDKFVGDSLMAIFGAPISHGNDTLDAVRCALRLLQEREKLHQTSQHKLCVGIGLATGNAVAGCMGSIDRMNYTVLGERVNLASRLCDRAAAGEVLIDQTTKDQLGGLITVEAVPELQLKGFAETVLAYKLLEVRRE